MLRAQQAIVELKDENLSISGSISSVGLVLSENAVSITMVSSQMAQISTLGRSGLAVADVIATVYEDVIVDAVENNGVDMDVNIRVEFIEEFPEKQMMRPGDSGGVVAAGGGAQSRNIAGIIVGGNGTRTYFVPAGTISNAMGGLTFTNINGA